MEGLGKALLLSGLVIAAIGAGLWLLGRNGGGLLPGDLVVERRNVRVYFPLATCLLISLALSALAWFFRR